MTFASAGSPPGAAGAPPSDVVPAGELRPDGDAAGFAPPPLVGVEPVVEEDPVVVGNGLWTVVVGRDGVLVTVGGGGGGGKGTDGREEVTETIEVIDVTEVIEVMDRAGGRPPSARACPVRKPAPSRAANAAARRIPPQLQRARSGCGV